MKVFTKNVFELVFYSVLGILSSSLFLLSFGQGLYQQWANQNVLAAFLHYLAALLGLVTATIIFLRAHRVKKILSQADFLYALFGD